ncbi:hypothetical protein ACLQ26_00440 [Micromonospora sp. DT43]|uniref:hypothetical protein n=1 Tax=Micromonospora sp. DT43 TaxID=3393440 RepID=UPI003CF55783
MVPTLAGRIQTRLVLLAVVGSLVTAIVTPLLPSGVGYRDTFGVLLTVAVLGVGWELVYHLLMQFRWEKDWPLLFGLGTGVPEAALIWLLLDHHVLPGLAGPPPLGAFLLHFSAVWLAVWLVANGPMRVPFLRWRFFGGRLG